MWHGMAHLWATQALCHSIGAVLNSDSFIVFTTQLMVGVLNMTGIWAENLLGHLKQKRPAVCHSEAALLSGCK